METTNLAPITDWLSYMDNYHNAVFAEHDAQAMYNLGIAYLKGGVVDKNLHRALVYFIGAAECGHQRSMIIASKLLFQFNADRMNKPDLVNPTDFIKKYLVNAAQAGSGYGMYLLVLYNYAKSGSDMFELVKAAAKKGCVPAQEMLAELYEQAGEHETESLYWKTMLSMHEGGLFEEDAVSIENARKAINELIKADPDKQTLIQHLQESIREKQPEYLRIQE